MKVLPKVVYFILFYNSGCFGQLTRTSMSPTALRGLRTGDHWITSSQCATPFELPSLKFSKGLLTLNDNKKTGQNELGGCYNRFGPLRYVLYLLIMAAKYISDFH